MRIMSATAAPRGEVMSPRRCGSMGSGFLRLAAKRPSGCSRAFSCSKASCKAPRHFQPVLRPQPQEARVFLVHKAAQLRRGVLQGEVVMPVRRDAEVRHLALHPGAAEAALQHLAPLRGQPRDAPDLAPGDEFELSLLRPCRVARAVHSFLFPQTY